MLQTSLACPVEEEDVTAWDVESGHLDNSLVALADSLLQLATPVLLAMIPHSSR